MHASVPAGAGRAFLEKKETPHRLIYGGKDLEKNNLAFTYIMHASCVRFL